MADDAGTGIWVALAALGGAFVTAIAGLVKARFDSKPAVITAEAALGEHVNARIVQLFAEHQASNDALRGEVRGLKALISHLIAHMDVLERTLDQHGIKPPPRNPGLSVNAWPFDVILGERDAAG